MANLTPKLVSSLHSSTTLLEAPGTIFKNHWYVLYLNIDAFAERFKVASTLAGNLNKAAQGVSFV